MPAHSQAPTVLKVPHAKLDQNIGRYFVLADFPVFFSAQVTPEWRFASYLYFALDVVAGLACEDADCIVLDKEAGMAIHPSPDLGGLCQSLKRDYEAKCFYSG